MPVTAPRFSPDGGSIAFASRRDGAPEVYRVDAEGGTPTRLTWWGEATTRAAGWPPDGAVVALSAHGDATSRLWAYAVPATGGTPELLPHGTLSALAHQPGGPAVLTQVEGGRDAAHWKRYRGGRAGRLWLDATGTGEFTRVLAGLAGQLECPMIVDDGSGPPLAFVSDHEGWGNVYSVPLADPGTDLRRHTDHGSGGGTDFYVRHASTDGRRVVYASAGEIFLLDDLSAASQPRRIDVRPGGPRRAREPFRASLPADLGPVRPDRTGRASIVSVLGTVHRLTHRDGPARALLAEPGVRARPRRRPPRPPHAARCPGPASTCGPGTCCWRCTGARSTRTGGPRRCSSRRPGARWSSPCAPDPTGPTRAPSAAWRCARCTPRTSCATRTGWPGCAPRSPSGPRGGWATCTCRT
ncbi:hypothetical protein XF36_20925 [Pseudonocardia sp. HH130629-09]|nr:hypothetical protein XF36_20925 [Pseudonocardia sp. HH130629-09]